MLILIKRIKNFTLADVKHTVASYEQDGMPQIERRGCRHATCQLYASHYRFEAGQNESQMVLH